MSTVEEKCKMIAEWEGLEHVHHGTFHAPDYAHDLNATMRAARRLPLGAVVFELSLGINEDEVCMAEITTRAGELVVHEESTDPARAAFECLAAYLEGTITRA